MEGKINCLTGEGKLGFYSSSYWNLFKRKRFEKLGVDPFKNGGQVSGSRDFEIKR